MTQSSATWNDTDANFGSKIQLVLNERIKELIALK